MAAPDPLCPSKSYQSTKPSTIGNHQMAIRKKNTVIIGVPSSSYRQNRARDEI
jgi:hypothetical protein